MGEENFQSYHQGGFVGKIRTDFLVALDDSRIAGLLEEIRSAKEGVLAKRRHWVVVRPIEVEGETKKVVVKAFGSQQGWKDRYDHKRGSKAARSFRAAEFLKSHGVDTPAPVAYLERWEGRRLEESYYLSEYLSGLTSFKKALTDIYDEGQPCDRFIDLLIKVSGVMRKMHDAGFYHRDLGNQNIELTRTEDGEWDEVNIIDLNRGRIREELTAKERALDFARLSMPSGFLEILVKIYWHDGAPKEFHKEMKRVRRNFRLWSASRRWRHPIKSWKKGRYRFGSGLEDVWIWDRRSAQASITMDKADRKAHQSNWNHLKIAGSVLKSGWPIWKEYGKQMKGAFQKKVDLAGRIGMSLEPTDLDFAKQLEYLPAMGKIPILLRFGHHEGRAQWEKTVGYLNDLHEKGHEIMVAILQDRKAVLEPESWRSFLEYVLGEIEGKVEMVELCHVVNRMKWGIRTLNEHAQLLKPVIILQEKFPGIHFSGPACIDFEYHYLVASLNATPKGLEYDALSHHLYVDRRRAPENKQGKFNTVEKAGLLKAIARWSGRCEERVIVSEVNWPLEWTGVWSPVSATYQPAKLRGSRVHVTEEEYGCFMLRYLVLTICSGFVDQVYWWRLVAHGFGLIDDRAEGGWRERIAFKMLSVFLKQLGQATFVEKLEVEDEVYALRFEREDEEVVMMWCNGRTYSGPWPVELKRTLNATGEAIELEELGDSPVYVFV
ncbi:MAG: lipopolysaccharide kinase InaA family protein [Akkermansiaceae bacterium]